MSLVRHTGDNVPYWQAVLNYSVAGNLQSVLDEYVHLLVESKGPTDRSAAGQAEEIRKEIAGCLTLRTSVAKADLFHTGKRTITLDDPLRMRTRFAMRLGNQEAEDSSQATPADHVRSAFNSPFWPFVLATTSVGQEGLDFHPYCHAVVHWNLPSNPVDLEQREGRVHRYKGHALRKNIASRFPAASNHGAKDPWAAMFAAARASRTDDHSDLFPFWIAPEGDAKIERHIPALPHSREVVQQAALLRSLVLYRMVFGQNRQEDLVEYLHSQLSPDEVEQIVELARIDLSPPQSTGPEKLSL